MDKLKYIKLKNEDGSYTDSIPLAVDSDYVDVSGDTLTNKLGTLATKTEVQAVASGSPAGVYDTISDLTADDPDHSKIYLVSDNGHWYYYNNGWQDGGQYQSNLVADGSISYNSLSDESLTNLNLRTYYTEMLKKQDVVIGNLEKYNFVNHDVDSSIINTQLITNEKMIYIPDKAKIKLNILNNFSIDRYRIYLYNINKEYIGVNGYSLTSEPTFFEDVCYIRICIIKSSGIDPSDIINFSLNLIKMDEDEKIIYKNDNINLVNPEKVNLNTFINTTTHKLSSSSDYNTTDFIPVLEGNYITLNRIRMYDIYDEYKNYIGRTTENIAANTTISIPSTANYIRFTFYKSDSDIMFYRGTSIISYQPFKKKLEDLASLSNTMETEVNNLINNTKYDLISRTTNEALLDYDNSIVIDLESYDWINKDIVNSTGDWGSYNSSVLTNSKFIYIPKKCKINLSLLNNFTINYYDIYQYTEDGTYLGVTSRGDIIEPFTVEGVYIRIRIVKSNIVADNITNIKLILQKELSRKIEYVGTNINLINPETDNKNKYINQTNFKLSDGTSYNTTDFIPIEYNTTYTTLCRIRMYVLYDKYKTRISKAIENIDANTQMVFSDEKVGYIRISYYNTDSYPMFYKGDAIISYKPFKKVLEDSASLSKTMESEVKDLISNVNAQNVLTGKKLVTCGDSFTQYTNATFDGGIYDGYNKVWPYLIGLRNNMVVHNMAISGATMSNGDFASSNKFSVNLYKQIDADADYIILKFGINDENYQAPIGTIDDTENTTFYGAWNTVMPYIIANHPTAKIGIIVTNGLSIHTEHPNNSAYANAIIEIAKKYGIPTLNEWNDPNVPLLLRTGRTDVDESIRNIRLETFRVNQSNTHENYICHEYESTFIEDFLRRL